MSNLERTIEALSKSCYAVDPLDYIKDGLVHCYKCNTPKECVLNFIDKARQVFCLCQCDTEKRDAIQIIAEKKVEKEEYNYYLHTGIMDETYRQWTFEKDDGSNDNIDIAHIYTDSFMEDFYPKGMGMVLWGNIGTGKTFMAACIANALIKKKIPVVMTSFTKIINDIFGLSDKTAYFQEFNHYKLMIIDDLGTERQSDYALEQVFHVIDERYKNNQPLLVTTNLTTNEMNNPKNVAYSRIYDRILEKCTPIGFTGKNYRNELKDNQIAWAKEKFNR